jgi:hypothetical protein
VCNPPRATPPLSVGGITSLTWKQKPVTRNSLERIAIATGCRDVSTCCVGSNSWKVSPDVFSCTLLNHHERNVADWTSSQTWERIPWKCIPWQLRSFNHNFVNSILQQMSPGKETWMGKLRMYCSEFHQWLFHFNRPHGGLYYIYSLVPEPQNFLNFQKLWVGCQFPMWKGWIFT